MSTGIEISVDRAALIAAAQQNQAANRREFLEGKAREVKINIGLRRNGRVEITQGLSKGDKVVTAGHLKIRDGAAVKIVASAEGA